MEREQAFEFAAILLVATQRAKHLRKGKVVGIISRANLMRALASIHRASSKTSQNDQEIRKRIVADIQFAMLSSA
jgi:hypothetical protein